MSPEIVADTALWPCIDGFKSAEPMDAVDGIVPSPVLFQLRQESIVAPVFEIA